MSSPASPRPADRAETAAPDQEEDTLPGIIIDRYNTVFERVLDRTTGERSVPPVVACVAYSLYKQEKRDWIIKRREELGRRPRQDEIDGYVSSFTDLRLESLFTQARELIDSFARDLLDSSKEELSDAIYRRQFESLHDQLRNGSELIQASSAGITSHITDKTKPAWWTSIGQNLVANFFWTVIVVLILVSLNLGFDFNNFGSRIKAFFNPPVTEAPPSKEKSG